MGVLELIIIVAIVVGLLLPSAIAAIIVFVLLAKQKNQPDQVSLETKPPLSKSV